VLEKELGAAIVIDVRPALRVVHRIGEIPDEHRLPAILHHLTEAERPARDAFVDVHPHENDAGDALGFQQIPHFHAGVGDRVANMNLEHVGLPRPGGRLV
jgi:hypothetical protein